MRFAMGLSLIVAASMLAGCNSSTAGCTTANCTTLESSCQLEPSGSPLGICVTLITNAGGTAPSDLTDLAASECVKACTAHGDGPVVACQAQNAAGCTNSAGGPQSVTAACTNGQPTVDETCADNCFSNFQTCAQACPASSLSACLSCGDACDNTYAACEQKCPTAS